MKNLRAFPLAAVLAAALFVGACASAPAGPTATAPAGAVAVSANLSRFAPQSVTAPAGTAFQIWFNNLENVPHNVHVLDATGTSIARGEIFNGPAAQILDVPALNAATYRLVCDVHPDMTGSLVAN